MENQQDSFWVPISNKPVFDLYLAKLERIAMP